MHNVLVFQPYLSNRKLSSNTIERQFRFLKKENVKVHVMLTNEESDYAERLAELDWVVPFLVGTKDLNFRFMKEIQKTFNFKELYIARTYFTPCTEEDKHKLTYRLYDKEDFRYLRNEIPIYFSELNVPVKHIVYDPLELIYTDMIQPELYKLYSSMNNVKDAECHNFAELGYYDLGKEVSLEDKKFSFTFGATSSSSERTELLKRIKSNLQEIQNTNQFYRYDDFDNLVDNETYEQLASQSLFTYTIPSYCPEYMSFTRMLLALSQNTIPLLHPDNNLSCLFGEKFEHRESLKELFKTWTFSLEELKQFLQKDFIEIQKTYSKYLEDWKNSEFYSWLKENV